MTVTILLPTLLFALVSIASTIATSEYVGRGNERLRGAEFGHVACSLAAAFIGGSITARGVSIESMLEMGLVTSALASTAYAGFFLGGAPADIPLGALAIVAIAATVHADWSALLGAVGVGFPFLVGALYASRRTDSIRDAAVAALAGALLGFGLGIGAAILGSFVAFVSALSRRKDRAQLPTPHFAPYIASALAFAILATALVAVG